jgi:hypothetical protein
MSSPEFRQQRHSASMKDCRETEKTRQLKRLVSNFLFQKATTGHFSIQKMEATTGFEPVNRGFADPRLNHLATSPQKTRAEDEIRTRDPLLGKEMLYR